MNLCPVTVVGDYKPGRVTTTVTDLVIPAPGLPITISRTYDSLDRNQSSDFGYGWKLGIRVDLQVAPNYDVTLTMNGQRRTFYFTPQTGVDPNLTWNGQPIGGVLNGFAWITAYTPEPGFHGKLESSNTGCAVNWLMRAGNTWICWGGAGVFDPQQYVYTYNAAGGLSTVTHPGGRSTLARRSNAPQQNHYVPAAHGADRDQR